MKILIVDDEESIRETLEMAMEMEGHQVLQAASGRLALESFHANSPDLIILDRMLPDGDGLEVCQSVRQVSAVPILMLTALGELEDRVSGLDSGADDYLAKPFRVKELQARVRALLRRGASRSEPSNSIQFERLRLDLNNRQAWIDQREIELTALEFQLLAFLVGHPRQVFSKEQLLNHVWGWDFVSNLNVVEVHISILRSKLGDTDKSMIRTVRGLGYALGR